MYSISGIKYQKELEQLPFFNKIQAGILIGKNGKNLDQKLAQLNKKGYLLPLKKGFYTTSLYLDKTDKQSYSEYIANNLRSPSYISSEYILSKSGLIPEAVVGITSITIKSSRNYTNILGNFIYQNIKSSLFCGYQTRFFTDKQIYVASTAKALFDFLYLKKLNHIKQELTADLRINWENFSKENLQEFQKYVHLSGSKKMSAILKMIYKYVS